LNIPDLLRQSFKQPFLQRFGHNAAGLLAVVYLIAGLLSVSVMAFAVPPYQNPDEPNHFLRAEQISRFGLLATRLPSGLAGGVADIGVVKSADIFRTVAMHPETKVTAGMFAATRSVSWGHGTYLPAFSNTALYPPVFYLPAAMGIMAGKSLNLTVVQTLYLARLTSGASATALAAAAIFFSGSIAPAFFVVMCFPMTLALFAAVSQDGMLIAITALAVAWFTRCWQPLQSLRPSTLGFCAFCSSVALISAARPPYAICALMILLVPWKGIKQRILALLLVETAVVGWFILASNIGGLGASYQDKAIRPATQLAFIIRHPLHWVQVLSDTLTLSWQNDLQTEIIGRLGSLDVFLPNAFYEFSWCILALAIVLSFTTGTLVRIGWLTRAACVAGSVMASGIGIFLIQYVTWTPVATPIVFGVQGRYFLPLLLILLASVVVSGPPRILSWHLPLLAGVLLYPLLSIGTMVRMTVVRYYIG
jgi:uncharacterized membrane protein